jgi:hypothetical protein
MPDTDCQERQFMLTYSPELVDDSIFLAKNAPIVDRSVTDGTTTTNIVKEEKTRFSCIQNICHLSLRKKLS